MLISSSNQDRKSQKKEKDSFFRHESNLNFHSVIYIVGNWGVSEG